MGLLKSIGNVLFPYVSTGVSAVKGLIASVKGDKEKEAAAKSDIGSTLKTQAVLGAAALAITNPALAVTAAKSIIPKSLAGKAALAVAAPVAIGAVVKSSKTREAIADAPSSLFNLGGNVGELIEDPSLEKAGDIFKENPIAAGVLGAAGVAAVGLGAGSLIASLVNTAAVREGTEALKEAGTNAGVSGE